MEFSIKGPDPPPTSLYGKTYMWFAKEVDTNPIKSNVENKFVF